MISMIVMSLIILVIAISMSMVGKGGGNFYVLSMVLAGASMQEAATTSQLIMMMTSITSMLVFHKSKKVDWKLALVIDPPTDIMAFVGGYFAGNMDGSTLKIMFAILLIVISFFMFFNVNKKAVCMEKTAETRFGFWHRSFGGYSYTVNLWITLPLTALVGFFAGAVGISGGAFKIPLMVILCGIPMEIAIGTSAAMVAATALMGFLGHSVSGSINFLYTIPLAIMAVLGGLIGSRYAVHSKPKHLQKIFAVTNLVAALVMIFSILLK
ncbi:sulfite exporter TauE/SafE family protein [Clostridia bacterium]|nr:sulfite exporter TauE/SafE family protein [Clostridia bacterium]